MKKIKALGYAPKGVHWNYGSGHMVRISRATAVSLLEPHGPPNMGWQKLVCFIRQGALTSRLHVQNNCGEYYLCSAEE